MTCVVALKADGGTIVMGADSAGVGGWYSRSNRVDPKIYRIGDGKMLIGFTSSFRMGQLLGHALVLPEHHADVSIETWLVTDFVDAVRNCLKAGGFAKKDSEVESAGIFLVAYRGRIFHVQGDYQVGERAEPYDAVGCGFDLALGSLHATEQTVVPLTDRARARARMALEAAAAFSAGVHPPFIFEELAP